MIGRHKTHSLINDDKQIIKFMVINTSIIRMIYVKEGFGASHSEDMQVSLARKIWEAYLSEGYRRVK